MSRLILLTIVFCVFIQSHAFTGEKIKVVTTLPDLRFLAEEVGGDRIKVFAIAKGYQDPHFVDAKPSFVLKLKQADLFIQIGLDLEIGWAAPLLATARNSKIYFSGPGYVDASKGVELLEVPVGSTSELRAKGDIHIHGNPHYWLDPRNGKQIATNICNALVKNRPEFAAEFEGRLAAFHSKIDSAYSVWSNKMAPFMNVKIMAYHNSWPYFEKAFGLDIAGFIEPKPGIPPTPSHLISVIRQIRKEHIKAIIISPYFDDKPAQSVANRTGAEVIRFAPSVAAYSEIKTYFDLFDHNINALVTVLGQRQ